jgi:tRNA1Val (adenine37-N6)-methyltransferase
VCKEPTVPGAWQLTIAQSPEGYRFSLDAFLLADFVSDCPPGPLLDLGTGCGVVALLLARRFPQVGIVGLELQDTLITVARQNIVRNSLEHQVALVRADARQARNILPAGVFGTVVCNPPYRIVGRGRLNPNLTKAMARHELTLTLAQLLQACRHLLRARGLLVMVYHPSRLPELCARLAEAQLCPRRIRLVHSTLQAPASMVLVEAVRGGRDILTVLPPLAVHDARGSYTPEMQAIFQGRALGARRVESGVRRGRSA